MDGGDGRQAAALRAYVKLNRATRAVLNLVEKRVGAAGLTLTQLGVLEAVLHKGPMTQRELGRKVLSSAGNMTDVIDKLVRRELIVRTPRDRRSVQIELTESGRALIEALFPRHAADIGSIFSALSPAEVAVLDGLLRRLGQRAAALDEAQSSPQMSAEAFDIER